MSSEDRSYLISKHPYNAEKHVAKGIPRIYERNRCSQPARELFCLFLAFYMSPFRREKAPAVSVLANTEKMRVLAGIEQGAPETMYIPVGD